MRIDAWPAALFFCAALHAAAAAQPGYDLVPPRHDGPSKSPLTINEKTDEGIAAGERPEDHSMVNSPTDFCFYNHLNKCGSCVMDAGCGFCSDGPPSVKGRCMTGSKKGPTKYAGCKKWHYTVCALHSKPPAYVPAPPPAPKAIVEKPLVAEKKVQVKELPTNATKLTPWKVEQEVEAPVVHKKNKVGKKPSPSPVKAPATPKREAPKPVFEKINFQMNDFVKDIASQEADLHKELEHEKDVKLEQEAAEGHDDKADEGIEEIKSEIYGEEKRSLRQRRKKLEEDWKRQWMIKQKLSILHQTKVDVSSERKALKDVWKDLPSQLPPEALVQPGKTWANLKNKVQVLGEVHDSRGFLPNKDYLDKHGPHWQHGSNINKIHLGLGLTGGNGRSEPRLPSSRPRFKSLRQRL